MKRYWLLLLAPVVMMAACRKNDKPAPQPPPASQADLLKDSVYLYSKEVYLWSEVIPSYEQFNPRQYSGATDFESAQKVMEGIRRLQPLDRFSFVTTPDVSGGLQTGDDRDYGFFIKAASLDRVEPMDSVYWFVSYVYNQSPSGQNGLQRGWYITKINGTPIGYDNPSINILNNVFFGNSSSAVFEFKKPDGSTATLNLTKASFTANAVLYKNVFNVGGKKVGYFVFNQFFGAPSRAELAQVFKDFEAQGINELVVDLRYNPGGSTATQDTLANLIAPATAHNQVMYQFIFNSTLQNNRHQLIRSRLGYGNVFTANANSVYFKKAGNLNLSRVFFIVTGNSASASELLINNLKPYMDVKIVGEKTYGKPVGYFPIPVGNYDIYPVSFKTVNSAGQAEYYNGFVPDRTAPDGVNRNWGDVQEPSLAAVLRYIETGSFGRFTADEAAKLKSSEQTLPLNRKMFDQKFSGMFIERK